MTLVSNVYLARPIRLQRAYDCLAAAAGLLVLAMIEIALAAVGPADQPTMELGVAVVASFLVGRSAAVLVRSLQEPQSDLYDSPPRRPKESGGLSASCRPCRSVGTTLC